MFEHVADILFVSQGWLWEKFFEKTVKIFQELLF